MSDIVGLFPLPRGKIAEVAGLLGTVMGVKEQPRLVGKPREEQAFLQGLGRQVRILRQGKNLTQTELAPLQGRVPQENEGLSSEHTRDLQQERDAVYRIQ